MSSVVHTSSSRRPLRLCALACLLSAGVLCAPTNTPGARAALRRGIVQDASLSTGKPSDSATLEQCQTAEAQDERAATFAGEMTAVAGTAKMEMRIDVLERTSGEDGYHTVSAPGLGVWRSSAPGVKVYRYLKQITNLAGPAFYRAAVRFRWLNAKGRLIGASELRTRRCEQPGTATPSVPVAPNPGMPLE